MITYILNFLLSLLRALISCRRNKVCEEKKTTLLSFTLNLQKLKPTAVPEPKRNKKHVAGGTMYVCLIAI